MLHLLVSSKILRWSANSRFYRRVSSSNTRSSSGISLIAVEKLQQHKSSSAFPLFDFNHPSHASASRGLYAFPSASSTILTPTPTPFSRAISSSPDYSHSTGIAKRYQGMIENEEIIADDHQLSIIRYYLTPIYQTLAIYAHKLSDYRRHIIEWEAQKEARIESMSSEQKAYRINRLLAINKSRRERAIKRMQQDRVIHSQNLSKIFESLLPEMKKPDSTRANSSSALALIKEEQEERAMITTEDKGIFRGLFSTFSGLLPSSSSSPPEFSRSPFRPTVSQSEQRKMDEEMKRLMRSTPSVEEKKEMIEKLDTIRFDHIGRPIITPLFGHENNRERVLHNLRSFSPNTKSSLPTSASTSTSTPESMQTRSQQPSPVRKMAQQGEQETLSQISLQISKTKEKLCRDLTEEEELTILENERKIIEEEMESSLLLPSRPIKPLPPSGCYIYGSVGSGKSFLMKLFAEAIVEELHPKSELVSGPKLSFPSSKGPVEFSLKQNQDTEQSQLAGQNYRDILSKNNLTHSKVIVRTLHCNDFMRLVYQTSHNFHQLSNLERMQLGYRHLLDAIVAQVYGDQFLFSPIPLPGKPYSLSPPPPPALLLCFDEMQMHDIADARILQGAISYLIKEGAILMITSNRAPEDLFQAGTQHADFQPFINLIKQRCTVIRLGSETKANYEDSNSKFIDYRLLKYSKKGQQRGLNDHDDDDDDYHHHDQMSAQQVYHMITKSDSKEFVEKRIEKMVNPTGLAWQQSLVKLLFNRELLINTCIPSIGVAKFTFEEICLQPLSSVDYEGITTHFHTVIILDIPRLSTKTRNQARRLITFLDEAYNRNIRLICSAYTTPENLFEGTELKNKPDDFESLSMRNSRLKTEEQANFGRVDETEAWESLEGLQFERVDSFSLQKGSQTVLNSAVFSGETEKFAFSRALSRIFEIQSRDYLQRHKQMYEGMF